MKSAILILSVILMACAGSSPQRMDVYQYGDSSKSCEMLNYEIRDLEEQVEAKYRHRDDKITRNTAVAIVGGLLFWPALFALDTKSDELYEINSVLKRRDMLRQVMSDKNCSNLTVPNEQFLKNMNLKASFPTSSKTSLAVT